MKNRHKTIRIRNQDRFRNKEAFSLLKKLFFLPLASFFLLLFSCLLLLASCGNDDEENTITPKPRAYFRLTYPEKKYVEYDSVCPFKFEIPTYAKVNDDKDPRAEPCWLNIDFPTLNATINLTYKEVKGNLNEYLENSYTFVSKHQIKSSGIQEEEIHKASKKVYGLIYDIGGNAASSVQFFLTDSTKHFLRGALYFNAVPNTDSIKPSVEFIKKDIYRMIETFEWKDTPMPVSKASK